MSDNRTASKGGQVLIARERGVITMTMAAPGKKNALSQAMYRALSAGLREATASADVRVVVLQGEGGVFTSGNDVTDFAGRAPGEKPASIEFLETIATFPKPIIAQVDGLAVGVGCTMLLHCDLIYAAEGTRFQLPFVNLGLVPEAGSSYLLPRLMGATRAAELLFFGDMFSAQTARDVGIVTSVHAPDALGAHVGARAAALAAKPPNSLKETKGLLRRHPAADILQRIAEESVIFGACVAGPEHAEARAAFSEKRPADFSKVT